MKMCCASIASRLYPFGICRCGVSGHEGVKVRVNQIMVSAPRSVPR